MKTVNFPGKVVARRQGALDRFKGPDVSKLPDEEKEAAVRAAQRTKDYMVKKLKTITGNPLSIRSKKDRRDRAKVA